MNKDIYCKNCRFYKVDPMFRYPCGKNTGTDVHSTCNCQYNIDSHYSSKDPRKYISTPSIINRCHDCNWFQKEYSMNTYVWDYDKSVPEKYKSHGDGTFNINPYGGENGFYIGDKTIKQIVKENAGKNVEELTKRVDVLEVRVAGHDGTIEIISGKVNKIEERIDKNLIEGKSIVDGGSANIRPNID